MGDEESNEKQFNEDENTNEKSSEDVGEKTNIEDLEEEHVVKELQEISSEDVGDLKEAFADASRKQGIQFEEGESSPMRQANTQEKWAEEGIKSHPLEFYKSEKTGEWHWRTQYRSDVTGASSEGYKNKDECKDNSKSVALSILNHDFEE